MRFFPWPRQEPIKTVDQPSETAGRQQTTSSQPHIQQTGLTVPIDSSSPDLPKADSNVVGIVRNNPQPTPGSVAGVGSNLDTMVNSVFVERFRTATFAGAEHELQDAAGIRMNSAFLVAAVADGVTHSFRAKTLADRLVAAFVGDDSLLTVAEWQETWTSIRSDWYKEYSSQFGTFHPLEQALFIDPGCHATFNGIRVDLSEDGTVTVNAFRRGDAIALWLTDAGELVVTDPNVSFGNRPDTLGLPATHPNWAGFHVQYSTLPARHLILATDALADYFIHELANPQRQLIELLQMLTEEQFAAWCRREKNNGLKTDDYAYVVISFAEGIRTDPTARPTSVPLNQESAEPAAPEKIQAAGELARTTNADKIVTNARPAKLARPQRISSRSLKKQRRGRNKRR